MCFITVSCCTKFIVNLTCLIKTSGIKIFLKSLKYLWIIFQKVFEEVRIQKVRQKKEWSTLQRDTEYKKAEIAHLPYTWRFVWVQGSFHIFYPEDHLFVFAGYELTLFSYPPEALHSVSWLFCAILFASLFRPTSQLCGDI